MKRTDEGVPVDLNYWTVSDWADLWRCMVAAKLMISKRHTKAEPRSTRVKEDHS
jgi:hypothetical protein